MRQAEASQKSWSSVITPPGFVDQLRQLADVKSAQPETGKYQMLAEPFFSLLMRLVFLEPTMACPASNRPSPGCSARGHVLDVKISPSDYRRWDLIYVLVQTTTQRV